MTNDLPPTVVRPDMSSHSTSKPSVHRVSKGRAGGACSATRKTRQGFSDTLHPVAPGPHPAGLQEHDRALSKPDTADAMRVRSRTVERSTRSRVRPSPRGRLKARVRRPAAIPALVRRHSSHLTTVRMAGGMTAAGRETALAGLTLPLFP